MDEKKNKMDALQNNKGVTAVFVLFMLAGLIGVTVLAIDVGYIKTTRNELQNIADAGALAGAGYLGSVYKNLTYDEQQSYIFSSEERTKLVTQVNDVSQQNKASGVDISINDEDVIVGWWDTENKEVQALDSDHPLPTAVKVTARRDNNANSPITTFFAKAFNVISTFTNNLSKNLGISSSDINMMTDPIDVSADATAALTGPASVAEGELKLPVALSELKFPYDCDDEIKFSPTASCAGWHNYIDDDENPNDATSTPEMTDKQLGIIQGHSCVDDPLCNGHVSGNQWLEDNFDIATHKTPDATEIPQVEAGDEFVFNGGTVAALFGSDYLYAPDPDDPIDSTRDQYDGDSGDLATDSMTGKSPAPIFALFDYFRYRDGDGNDDWWTATIPVYKDSGDCTKNNPSGNIEIVGFAKLVVHDVNDSPTNSLSVYLDCNYSFIEGRGGGGSYGNLKGTIPNLVE